MASPILQGIGIGLAVAVPIGPMGLLCIDRTLSLGPRSGIATGFGAATVHLFYSSLAVLGFGVAARAWLDDRASAFSLASALILFWFAVRAFRRAAPAPVVRHCAAERVCVICAYLSAIIFGLTNPSTIVLLAAAFPALADVADPHVAPLLAGGVFIGSIGWRATLVALVGVCRVQFGSGLIGVSHRVSALALAGLGTVMLVNALDHAL